MAEENQPGISEEINSPQPVHSQSPAALAPLPIQDIARIAALEGNVTSLKSTVDLKAANMAKMMSLLRGPNHAASSSTPPPTHEPTVDPALWVSLAHIQESGTMVVPAPMVQPVSDPLLPPPALTDVPLPPTTFLMSDTTIYVPMPLSMLVPPSVHTVPLLRVFPTPSAFTTAQPTESFIFQTSQPNTSLPYQVPSPLNMPIPKPDANPHGTCSSTHKFPSRGGNQPRAEVD
ncbi:hypothetical protein CDL15_Pgr008074 [Punica granatum]|uniref:Extensin-like n=1 Tax=Punica granatum TaxID=22663 RepID=A0A218WM55_PUNGR|nr:hypothetical protein CDL15_Pgr008074 [Punica granatum]PKI39020.1 hypothetical protein CRG98_040586 [Punica granatum]